MFSTQMLNDNNDNNDDDDNNENDDDNDYNDNNDNDCHSSFLWTIIVNHKLGCLH